MRTLILSVILLLALMSIASSLPAPGVPQISYGCGYVLIHWAPADSADYHPIGYVLERNLMRLENSSSSIRILLDDTLYNDNDLVIGLNFYYTVRAIYSDGESEMRVSETKFLPDPNNVDYFLVGNDSELDLNDWYTSMLTSLGLHGAIIPEILPYCGDRLQNLRLLWLGGIGPNYHWYPTPSDRAIVDYLVQGGRVYMDDGWDYYSDTLSSQYLYYGYTTCMSYPFISSHGLSNTFTNGLWYQFPETLWSSNLTPIGINGESYDVLEDDVECGCVDVAVDHDGYKAVVNSQPIYRAIDNPSTGTRVEYFRRMLQFFDILDNVKQVDEVNRPDKIALTAYPNPFNAEVTMAISSGEKMGEAGIYDISGRLIRSLTNIDKSTAIWDGRNDGGSAVTSGVYFARIKAGQQLLSLKLTLMK
jgi:hypothetical protein